MIRQTIGFLAMAFLACSRCPACLCQDINVRAVQWSTLIAQAKLMSIGPLEELGASQATSAASTESSKQPTRYLYRTYVLEITDPMLGKSAKGDQITLVCYFPASASDNSDCGQSLAPDQIGKMLLVMARPATDTPWSDDPANPDPRPDPSKSSNALAIVHLQSADEMGKDGLADLKSLISDTQGDEAQFKQADAQVQASTLAIAADDVEAAEAEHALKDMGPRAIPALRAAIDSADARGKQRIQKTIDVLSPPPLFPKSN